VLEKLSYLPFAQARWEVVVFPRQQALRTHSSNHHHQHGIGEWPYLFVDPRCGDRHARPATHHCGIVENRSDLDVELIIAQT